MNTATISPAPGTALFHRFAWKEYRMLRGFWLAVAGLGVLMQWTTTQLMFKTDASASSLLLVAWGAAALYAVGAAVTLFSAEREERTHDFLLRLPGRWWPMFSAKVALAVGSAFCLGLILCAAGTWLAGTSWPSVDEFQNAAAIGGVAVLEAAAWGLLFSLCMKQPLLAAVSAIGAASFGAQLAIAATPAAHHAFSIISYREAVPLRLALTLAVFAVDLCLGARWLKTATSPSKEKGSTLLAAFATNVWLGVRLFQFATRSDKQRTLTASQSATATTASKVKRRALLTRLLWQTWGESWQTAVAAIPIALFLMVSLGLPLVMFQYSAPYVDLLLPMLTMLFFPALLGALVFRADQRGDHRQFLVAHAARPRYVWLARQLFWGTGLLLIALAVSAAVWLAIALESGDFLHDILDRNYGGGFPGGFYSDQLLRQPRHLAGIFDSLLRFAFQFTLSTWTAIFTAYALGQFCSLLLKREVLAGLLALLLSILLAAWALLTGAWQLSPLWFVLPLGLGAMLATWLRMPDWIVGRNRPNSWALPLISLVVPLLYVTATLPAARLAQLEDQPWPQDEFRQQVQKYEAGHTAGEETAAAYFRLHASIKAANSDAERQTLIEQLIELTKRPACRFPETAVLAGGPLYDQIADLRHWLFADAQRLQQEGELDNALDRYLAMVRLKNHRLRGQASLNMARELNSFGPIFLKWARHPDQTSELLRRAVAALQTYPATRIVEPFLADRAQIRAVLTGKESPSFLHEKQPRWSGYLAYLANQLPWERQRALQSLDLRIWLILNYVKTAHGDNQYANYYNNAQARLLLASEWYANRTLMPHASRYDRNWYVSTQSAWHAATSYLMTLELYSRINLRDFLYLTLDARTRRTGLITQLALIAYRLDHQRYPETLAELSPKYLFGLRNDPYADKPLEYRPQGFDLPLVRYRGNSNIRKSEFSSAAIPAQTPLLWSVGINNCEPRDGVITLTQDDGTELPENGSDDTVVASDEIGVIEVVRLEPPNDFYYGRSRIIFTLPKINPPEALPTNNQPEENDANEIEE